MKRSALTWYATLIALYHIIYAGNFLTWFGIFLPAQLHRSVSLASALTLIYLLIRVKKRGEDSGSQRVPWYDYVLMGMSLTGTCYVIFFYDRILDYATKGFLDIQGVCLAVILSIALLEAVRRTTGWAIPILILLVLCVSMFQQYLPGILYGQAYPIRRLFYSTFVGTSGIFGLPLGVASTILIVFMIFGALLQLAGAGKWFMELALSLTGWSRGGPAKAAVVSSALFGSISGSPSGNVATTGVFTIPLMKNTGYKSSFAGGVEAVASTGGQILPPVMGAIAFVMAEWIGVPYSQIAIAAAVPALLYFAVLFASVHLQACKAGIRALPLGELPRVKIVFLDGWFYLVPLVLLVYLLIGLEYSPAMSGIYTLPLIIACSFLSKDRKNWLTPRRIMAAFESGVKGWLVVASVTGAIGILVGSLELTGLGLKISRFILEVSAGDMMFTLILVGLTSLILGMGLDSIPAYITLATLVAPALVELGIPEMVAHLYVIYWGLASFITPPVCTAVFVACGISGSKIWETGWEAVKLGIANYLIPFAFVLSPGLLLQGTAGNIALDIGTALIGSIFLAVGIQGYSFTLVTPLQRVAFLVSGLLLIAPNALFPSIGLLVAISALLWQKVECKLQTQTNSISK